MISVYINDIKLSETFIKNSKYIQDLCELTDIPGNEIRLKDDLFDINEKKISIIEKMINNKSLGEIDDKKNMISNLIDIIEFYNIDTIEPIVKEFYAKEIIPKIKLKSMDDKKINKTYLDNFKEFFDETV